MDLKLRYALAAAIIGFVPFGTFALLLLEGAMFLHICHKHDVPAIHEGIAFVLAMAGISLILKFAAESLQVIPIIGQFSNSIIAFTVVYGLGAVIEKYAKRRSDREQQGNRS